MMLNAGCLVPMHEELTGLVTKEKVVEKAKRLNLPPEWFEMWILAGNEKKPGGLSVGAYFNKLFTENRPVFDKVHRAFYWKKDGATVDDQEHLRTYDSMFHSSLKLLAIKLAHGDALCRVV
jgi:hypothetical protein